MEPNVIPEHYEPRQDKFPYPAPFCLSSVERDWCMGDTERVLYIKRRHLEENLKTIARETGMDDAERTKFLDYWCSARGSETRAEGDPYFNLRHRASSWMERAKTGNKKTSRAEEYAESAIKFLSAHPGIIQTGSCRERRDTASPDEQ